VALQSFPSIKKDINKILKTRKNANNHRPNQVLVVCPTGKAVDDGKDVSKRILAKQPNENLPNNQMKAC